MFKTLHVVYWNHVQGLAHCEKCGGISMNCKRLVVGSSRVLRRGKHPDGKGLSLTSFCLWIPSRNIVHFRSFSLCACVCACTHTCVWWGHSEWRFFSLYICPAWPVPASLTHMTPSYIPAPAPASDCSDLLVCVCVCWGGAQLRHMAVARRREGLNPQHSRNPSRCSDRAGTLPHCATRELPILRSEHLHPDSLSKG